MIIAARHDNDGQCGPPGPQGVNETTLLISRHINISDDEMGLGLRRLVHPILAVDRRNHVVTQHTKALKKEFPDHRLVVDNKYSCHE